MNWKTKDGRSIAVKDMDDNHLLNSIRYLERKHLEKIYEFEDMVARVPKVHPEYPKINARYKMLCRANVWDIFPIHSVLFQEALDRGLRIDRVKKKEIQPLLFEEDDSDMPDVCVDLTCLGRRKIIMR